MSDSNKMTAMAPVEKLPTLNETIRTRSVEEGIIRPSIDASALRRYTLKCDLIIIPMVSFSYLLEYVTVSSADNLQHC